MRKRVLHEPLDTSSVPDLARLSAQAKNLLSGMLEKDPTKRLTIEEVLAHSWLN